MNTTSVADAGAAGNNEIKKILASGLSTLATKCNPIF